MHWKAKLITILTVLLTGTVWMGCDEDGTSSDAQTGTLMGTVYDEDSQSAVEGATVQTGTESTTSAADGSYELELIPAGENSINVQHEFYDNKTVEVTIPANDTLTQDFELTFGGFGKISGTVMEEAGFPDTDFEAALVGYTDTFDVSSNGQFLTDYVPIGSLTIDIVPEDHYFIERITNIEVTRLSTTDLGNINLRDLYIDRVIVDSCYIGGNNCTGYNDGTFAYSRPVESGCDGRLIVDLGENEEAIPASGLGLEMKVGGVGTVSGTIQVSDFDSTFADTADYYEYPNFSYTFSGDVGGSQVVQLDLQNTGMTEVRFVAFKIDNSVEEGRLYYIKVLNQRNNVE